MEIPKEMVVEQIRSHGNFERVDEAERELPEKVDPERDAQLLARLGVDVEMLAAGFGDQSPAAT
jgi:hypothetical protein